MSNRPVRLHRWDEIALEKVTEMISRKVVTGEREMIGQIYLKRGAVVPMHSHESEQITLVLSGALVFEMGGRSHVVRAGEVMAIPGNVPHAVRALEEPVVAVDAWSPVRDRYHRD